jgi:hypothetical protein
MTTEKERYPWFGAPPARTPRPSATEPTLRGKRVVLSTPEGFIYDMRAVSERYEKDGETVVDIVKEEAYFRWMFADERPTRAAWKARLVWVE